MKQLSLVEKAFFLKRTALFNTLDLDLLIAIADKTNQDIYDPKEIVFEKDQRANRLYLIVSGHVSVLNYDDEKIAELKEEDCFGDEALFNDTPRSYSIVCETQTLFLTLSKTHLMAIISECPSVAISLLQYYTKNTHCRHVKI
jgi:signal-transduction protein with cAMP-binding, CBS, and nucleotidyltransferase domain